MNKKVTFVIGGCRSGKSGHALKLAEKLSGEKRYYFATSVPFDDEMKYRVQKHQEERDKTWTTVESPLHLDKSVKEISPKADVILIDCLTLWVSNMVMEEVNDEEIDENIDKFLNALNEVSCPVIIVSNEVGGGVVPENRLARKFRDFAGFVNQKVAKYSGNVIWTVAGIPVNIKD